MEKKKKKMPMRIRVEVAADILEISPRQASKVLREISSKSNKTFKKVVTIREFCEHTGFSYEEMDMYFNGFQS